MEAKPVKNASSLLQFSGHSELKTGLPKKKFITARPITLKKNWSRCLYVMPFPVINIWLLICKAPSLMLTEHK